MYLVRGNSKLGEDAWTWSIPAGSTCPGKTAACASVCYAADGFFKMASVKAAMAKREEFRRSDEFVDSILKQIEKNKITLLRIHVAGDYDSVAYTRRWVEIMKAVPHVTAWTYTRSWRVPRLRNDIRKLAALPNVNFFLSCDRDTGAPPKWKNFKRAYMSLNDTDLPKYKVDLVFRDGRKTLMKHTPQGAIVCPVENGVTKTTCSSCQMCFKFDKLDRANRAALRASQSLVQLDAAPA